MAVMTRNTRFQPAPIQAARLRRRKFPWYFEMDSAALFMAGVTLLSLTCLLYLLQTSRVAVLGYEIQEVQAQQVQAEREAENLSYQVNALESLPVIEAHARKKLGMKPVAEYEYVRMNVSPAELRAPVRLRVATPQNDGEGR